MVEDAPGFLWQKLSNSKPPVLWMDIVETLGFCIDCQRKESSKVGVCLGEVGDLQALLEFVRHKVKISRF